MRSGGRDRFAPPHRWNAAPVGHAGSAQEREADRLAAQVLAGRSPSSRPREPAAGGLQGGTPAEGRPLDNETRSFFETRFGHDFGRVRVHFGGAATEAADELGASAFTFGHDVVLRDAGEASLGSARDPRFLAHELAHVVQEGQASGPGRMIRRKVIDTGKHPTGPGPTDYAATLHDYLLYLHSMKGAQGPQPGFNPYVVPTIEQVIGEITASPEFRDQVADAYKRMYYRDVVRDIIRYSTEDERDRLMRPFVSGKGDFPEPSKDKAVV